MGAFSSRRGSTSMDCSTNSPSAPIPSDGTTNASPLVSACYRSGRFRPKAVIKLSGKCDWRERSSLREERTRKKNLPVHPTARSSRCVGLSEAIEATGIARDHEKLEAPPSPDRIFCKRFYVDLRVAGELLYPFKLARRPFNSLSSDVLGRWQFDSLLRLFNPEGIEQSSGSRALPNFLQRKAMHHDAGDIGAEPLIVGRPDANLVYVPEAHPVDVGHDGRLGAREILRICGVKIPEPQIAFVIEVEAVSKADDRIADI